MKRDPNRHCGPAHFCAEHGITCDIEMIPIDRINEAYERMLKSDVKYRFVKTWRRFDSFSCSFSCS